MTDTTADVSTGNGNGNAKKVRNWLIVVSMLVGILVGASQLGFVWPWMALDRNQAALTYETKEHAEEQHRALREAQTEILVDIAGQLQQINEQLKELNKE